MDNEELAWVPITVIAVEYKRSPEFIRRWCVSGFILELGYSLRRDLDGRWLVGVPQPLFERFSSSSKNAF